MSELRIIRSACVACALALVITGCQRQLAKPKLSGPRGLTNANLAVVENAVRERISTGMSAAVAKEHMEGLGFRCVKVDNGTFRYHQAEPDGGWKTVAMPSQDYLSCSITGSKDFVDSVTIVAILLHHDAVSDIIVTREYVGL